ncbi:MAG TPA: radical SAM/SPASM domain-containing protein [Thermoanaerobaculia bacterium]|nr:radical SAM/SPASM domain-containing protein [Thermoanaerobaculia bacterium]
MTLPPAEPMNESETPSSRAATTAVLEAETVSPYLHERGSVLYNPISGESLAKDGPGFRAISLVRGGLSADVEPAVLEQLRAARFLIDDLDSETRRTHLLFVSLETCTSCNHRCPFCPVSVDPREREVMSQELFESIADQVVAIGGKDVVVFLSNYNEPTIDPLFEERCLALFARGLPVSLLTNASHFGPERADRLARAGRFRYIGINLPTLDPDRYEKMHGTRDLARVLGNIQALAAREIAEETAVVVLGNNDAEHRRDVEEIRARFGPLGWDVKSFRIRSRPASGTFVPEPPPVKELRGCELMGSRPFEHLHVTATAKAVLCCQDYYEKLVVGDLKTQTVAEVLGGDVMARLRRWTYGVEQAPDDFLCRRCEFALGR